MSIIGSNILAGAAGSGVSAYEIEQSLRFDGSSGYLSRTHSNNNASSDFTLSMWFKKAYNGENNMMLLHTNTDPRYSYVTFGESSGDADLLIARGASGYYAFGVTRKYRDPSAWYHIVLSVDVGTITKGYVNGVLDSNAGGTGNWAFNGTDPQAIGRQAGVASNYFSGYMAEVHFIDGQALDADSFGEFDDNGVWRPIEYTGTFGSNGYYLKFDPTATNGIGHDHSGNGNNWTASGFTTSGTGTDVMSDTPTNNFCTWNPLDNTGVTLKNGNLDFGYAGAQDCGGTFALSSGKWYWEIEVRDDIGGGGQPLAHGIHNASVTSDFRKQAIWFYTDEISAGVVRRYANNSVAASVSIPSALRAIDIGDYLQVAYDADSGKVWFAVNNTWMDGSGGTSGNPGSGSNPVFTLPDTSIPMTPWRSHAGLGWEGFTNFGQRDFQYTPPTGFNGVSTSNLPAPTIKDGSKNFNTVLYQAATSNGTYTHGDLDFRPDFTWIKNRDNVERHFLIDVVRGNTSVTDKFLVSNSTAAEGVNGTAGTTFSVTDTGYQFAETSIGTGELYFNNRTYVGWNWKAGGSGSSNTDGSITSTVSANPTAGFSIVSYSGNNNSSATVGHGLGVSPDLVIVKDRSTSNYVWMVKFAILGGNILQLDGAGAANAPSSYSTGTIGTLTSTTFGFTTGGSLQAVNNTGQNYIAYCFAEVEGYSKMGTYTGSTGFPFVYCGFRPAFILLKPYDLASGWYMYDSTRGEYNVVSMRVLADTADQETSAAGNDIDILSNGFKLRGASNSGSNYNGKNYIFYAVAENPFGGSGVSPATAR